MSAWWAALGLPLLLAIDAGGGAPPGCGGGGEVPPPSADSAGAPPDLDGRYGRVMEAADDLVSSLRQTPGALG